MAEKKRARQTSSASEEENSESIIISRKEWSSILERIENLESKVEEGEKLNHRLEAELAESQARINQLEREVNVDIKTSLEFAHSEVETVQDRVDRCEKEQSIQESKIMQQDLYSRRWNLLFFGFDEEEVEGCEKKVTQVTQSVGLDGRFVRFCGVHRLGRKQKARNGQPSRPRPIIARFTCRADRNTIWRVRREIYKSARIGIKEDLPKEIRETRKNILGPAMRKALKEKPNIKATILGD